MSTSSSPETRGAAFPVTSQAAQIVWEQHSAGRQAYKLGAERPIVTGMQRKLYDFLTETRNTQGLFATAEQGSFVHGAMAAHLLLRHRVMTAASDYTMATYREILPEVGAPALHAVHNRIITARKAARLGSGPAIILAACRDDYAPNIEGGLAEAATDFVARYEHADTSHSFSAGLAVVASAFEEQYRLDHPSL